MVFVAIASVGGLLLLLAALAGVDLVRRSEAVPYGWLLSLAALCATSFAWVFVLPPFARDPWAIVQISVTFGGIGAAIGIASCSLGAVALALSRGLRPGGPARWRRWRLGIALVALSLPPAELAVRGGAPALWLYASWICLPVVLAFARDGSERLERGGAVALGLIWLATLGGIALVALMDLVTHLIARIGTVEHGTASAKCAATASSVRPVPQPDCAPV